MVKILNLWVICLALIIGNILYQEWFIKMGTGRDDAKLCNYDENENTKTKKREYTPVNCK